MPNANMLRGLDQVRGLWSVTGDPTLIDAAASVGPDFICIDVQHGRALATVDASLFTSMSIYGVAGLVRVEANNPSAIGRSLDLGAVGVVIPQVDAAADAELAVAATRYAPAGTRSFGMQTRRVGPFDGPPFVVIQVETAKALDEIDEIAAVDGVDCLYVGPADLGLSLGGVPAVDVNEVLDGSASNAAELRAAFDAVLKAGETRGIHTGVHCGDGATAGRIFGMGFTFAAVTTDIRLLMAGLGGELKAATTES